MARHFVLDAAMRDLTIGVLPRLEQSNYRPAEELRRIAIVERGVLPNRVSTGHRRRRAGS